MQQTSNMLSHAALVACVDSAVSYYTIATAVQRAKDDIIYNMRQLVFECLQRTHWDSRHRIRRVLLLR